MSDAAERPLRVLHFPTDVGGNAGGLAEAERRLGLESRVAVIERSWLDYPVDLDLDLGDAGRWRRLGGRARFGLAALRDYDVLHFNFGHTFLPALRGAGIDLPLLRAAGKRLFMTFQGCDVRRTGYCRANFALSCCGADQGGDLCRAEQDAAKSRTAAWATRFCHRVFCLNPDLLHVVPGAEFVPYASIDPKSVQIAPPRAGGPIRILHAPTSRAIKGTDAVLAAIDALRGEFEIETILVENMPHEDAMRRYRDADLLVDQLKVGWYGALAVELMSMGKPVIAYIREDDLRHLPPGMADALPVISATPDTIAEVLRGVLSRRSELAAIGSRSRAYVEEWHDPDVMARRLRDVYEDPEQPFWR